MNLILFGAPGAGKGTQAALLVKDFNMIQISTGDLFRAAIKNQTELGLTAKSYMDKGMLVPDSVTVGMVRESILKNANNSFILDGFPRNLDQVSALDGILAEASIKIDKVVSLEVSNKDLVNRIAGRRVCKSCGAVYNITEQPPKKDGVCDKCGSELIHRVDDNASVVEERLKVYSAQTSTVKDHYRKTGLLVEVNGNQDMDLVFLEIKKKCNL